MRTTKVIHVVSCHAEGEVGDVIVGGVAPPPGDTIWEQSRFIARDETLRNLVLNEPRGGVFRHVNLLVPPKNPQAQMGWIIMEPADTPPIENIRRRCASRATTGRRSAPDETPRRKEAGRCHDCASARSISASVIARSGVRSFCKVLQISSSATLSYW